MANFLDRLLARQHPLLREARVIVPQVAAEEAALTTLSDDELRGVTETLRAELLKIKMIPFSYKDFPI